jgi:hypothetical protein
MLVRAKSQFNSRISRILRRLSSDSSYMVYSLPTRPAGENHEFVNIKEQAKGESNDE